MAEERKGSGTGPGGGPPRPPGIVFAHAETPFGGLWAMCMYGWHRDQAILDAGGQRMRYLNLYRCTYRARPACPAELYLPVLRLLYRLHLPVQLLGPGGIPGPILQRGFYAVLQQSNGRLCDVAEATLGNYALRACGQVALRVIRMRNVWGAPTDAVSRLTLTIDGTNTAQAVSVLCDAMLAHRCIENWKIMILESIGTGPDDIVIYLNAPLGNALVGGLIQYLSDRHEQQPFLADGPPPLGCERCAPGIFGSEMPAVVSLNGVRFSGSHGMDRAIIVTAALQLSRERGVSIVDALEAVLRAVGLDPANPSRRLLGGAGGDAGGAAGFAKPPGGNA